MITLVEFIHPLRNHSMRDLCLAVMYYQHYNSKKESLSVDEIRAFLKAAKVSNLGKANIADVLAKSAPYVHTVGKSGLRFLWALTSSGEAYVRKLLGLPEPSIQAEQDISTLEKLLGRIANEDSASYVEEALKCLRCDAMRAAVVFLWAGAVRVIQEKVIATDNTKLNVAIQRHEPRARAISTIDDFALIREKTLLLAAQDVGVFDKNERTIIEDALDLRNKCGHPGKYRPGPNKVRSFIEDLISIIFK